MNAAALLKLSSACTEHERVALGELSQAVYPPEQAANWQGRHLEWDVPAWRVLVFDGAGELVCHVGVVLRNVQHDDRLMRIGGVGGVMTHPSARRRGYAAMGLRRAVEFFQERADVAFALLVCEPELLKYYSSLGWKEFQGRLLTLQRGQTQEFTFNRVMVLDVRSAAPLTGTIDLLGPPW